MGKLTEAEERLEWFIEQYETAVSTWGRCYYYGEIKDQAKAMGIPTPVSPPVLGEVLEGAVSPRKRHRRSPAA